MSTDREEVKLSFRSMARLLKEVSVLPRMVEGSPVKFTVDVFCVKVPSLVKSFDTVSVAEDPLSSPLMICTFDAVTSPFSVATLLPLSTFRLL